MINYNIMYLGYLITLLLGIPTIIWKLNNGDDDADNDDDGDP